MKRIFVEKIENNSIILDVDNLHYIKHVLRFTNGQKILLFDGEKEYCGTYNYNRIDIQNVTRYANDKQLWLAIAEIKQHRFEWLAEKAAEIGVTKIFILKTERSQNRINLLRIKKIIIEAAKQSNRVSIPIIHHAISLNDFIISQNATHWCYCSPDSDNTSTSPNIIGSIIGPEGGFTEEEIKLLNSNMLAIKLNDNVLRSETAALCALCKIHSVF
jgi:16S rRNA (uracil1498-N3)-methyltransferase